jgi:hypothetical protein
MGKNIAMKAINKITATSLITWLCVFGFSGAFADSIVMSSGQIITGTAVQTNGDDVLILMHCAAFNFSKLSIKEIKPEAEMTTEDAKPSRLLNFQKAVSFLSQQSWATNLTPIPATVIDKGILRNVPYTSLRCGQDYEVNIYGDLERPSGIEIGVYRKLLDDSSAKSNCVKFINDLLRQSADKEVLQSLNLTKDLKAIGDLTFEITPPTDEDAYNGWWVSVYSVKQLNLARASDSDMQLISMTQVDAAKDVNKSTNIASWSASDLKQARPATKTIITFKSASGMWITNAEVVRVIDGVSLIWKSGPTSGGMVRLADLPEDLRNEYGYDEAKTKAADDLSAAQKAAWQQQVQASAQAAEGQNDSLADSYSNYSGGDYSSGGRVYVHGYTRKNGTYVNAYTRSYPHKH